MVMEWRIIHVQKDAQLLEHMEPGKWIALEIISHYDLTESKAHLRVFRQLEQLWKSHAPRSVKLHHGKAHAYASLNMKQNLPDTASYAFQDKMYLSETYTNTVRQAFTSKMTEFDSNGIFRAGALLSLLNITSEHP
jgi:hypothetical protein